MKQSINLKLSTQVRMTPQLQHAIKLLQMSTLDLQQEIQENLENNPLLEIEDNQLHESTSKENLETIEDNQAILDLSFEQEHLAKNSKATDLEDDHVTEKLENPLSEDLP